ncbi:zinc metalloprotease [Secundilactobacillus muriivasis]
MKKTTLKTLAMSFVVATTLGVGALVSQPTSASAASDFSKFNTSNHTVTYHINSTSNYYHGMWANAVKAWSKNGTLKFKEVAKNDNPKLTLSTEKGTQSDVKHGYANRTSYDGLGNRTAHVVRATVKDLTLKEKTSIAEHSLGLTLGLNKESDSSSSIMNVHYSFVNSITKTDLHNLAALYK